MDLQNITIKSILNEKSSSVYFVEDSDTVITAVRLMNKEKIGSVMVVSKNQYVGIFTERDVLNRVVSPRLNTKKTLVSEVMTKNFSSIDVSLTLQETLHIMTKNRIRHLPVFQNTRLLGMVSIGDVTRKLLEINQNEANSLRDYLFTSYSG
ncbi:MAG: histidine kinase [Opitutae bacterium]|nr:histidine kinase [Opitutae bacterium]|tara:strand:- start:2499 stop:2951 length:453 start_codon:yes stop_codon:yes gene_type:complete